MRKNLNNMIKNFILILIAIFLSNSSFSLNQTDYEGHPYYSASILAQFFAEKNNKKKEKIIVDFIKFFIAKEEEETRKKNKSDYKGETSEEFISKYFQLKKELYTSLFSSSDTSFFGRTMLYALDEELRKRFLDQTSVLTSLFNGTDKDLLYLITSYQEHFMSSTSNSAPSDKKNAAINTNNYLKAKIDYNVNIILFGLPNKRPSAIHFDYKDCQDIYNNKLAKALTNSMVIFDLNSSKLFDSDDQKFLNLIKDQNVLMPPDQFSFPLTVQNTELYLDIQATKYVHNLIHYILAEIKTQQDIKESNRYYEELMSAKSSTGKKNKSTKKAPPSSTKKKQAPAQKSKEPEKKDDKSERNKRKKENRRLRNEAIKEEERAKAEAKLAEKEEQDKEEECKRIAAENEEQERKKIAVEKEEQEPKKIAAEKEEQERKKIAVEKEEQEPKRIVAEQELKPQSPVAGSTKRKKRKKRRKQNIEQESFA